MSKYKYDHDCPFEAFITNLGKYNEGKLVGEWVKFPVTEEYLEEVFKRIGIGEMDVNGRVYEEWFVSDYDNYSKIQVSKVLGLFPTIDELNRIGEALTKKNIIL